ncbi:hypothetical protein EJ06DRAFT_560340 [Trichodelitschia bisporula]|uniref:Uncharacterized protein n=1 Tax=Trichodelitschia bisporula TaxID=703511 RepID=A0A6G1HJB8_9PEZI|nr:hypothetical protein EJ06DRAFT_560340 [Trichodelitschia bisporula]
MASERSRVIFTLKSTADWRLWDAAIRDELESNLLYTIDDKEERLNIGRDDIPAEARKKVDNAAARAILRANLSIEQAVYMEGLTAAKDIYETPRKIHTSQSEARVWQLIQQLINIIGMTDKTVDGKSQRLVRAQMKLNKMALKDISVSKTFLSIFLIQSMGPEYATTIEIIQNQDKVDFDDIVSKLKAKELELSNGAEGAGESAYLARI